MTATQQFIEDAIRGGWEIDESIPNHPSNLHRILLDPLAWQAVGKTRGWPSNHLKMRGAVTWLDYWHRFIEHLADGETIDEALAAIA